MGSRGIPSTVGGRGAVERVGLEDQHGEFIQVRPQMMRNTLLLLVCVYLVFLDELQSVQVQKV